MADNKETCFLICKDGRSHKETDQENAGMKIRIISYLII